MKKLFLVLMMGMFSVVAEAQLPLFALKIMGGINAPSLKIPDAAVKAAFLLFSLQYEPSFTDLSTTGASKSGIFVAKVGISIL